MSNLKYWQEKIKQKRKQTSWDDFIKEIASWFPIMMNKNKNLISVFPESPRS
jgi:spermidine/putrescine-binding protein